MNLKLDSFDSLRWPLIAVCALLLLSPGVQAGSVLSAGFLHVCGIQADLTLVCWGDNAENQASLPTGEFDQVSAGAYFNCALNIGSVLNSLIYTKRCRIKVY